MQRFEPVRVGKRGTITIPAALRQQYRLEEGSFLVLEPRKEGILLKPACVYPVEVYTPERRAEFLLNNAVTPEDYAWAVEEVRKMGLDPKTILHDPPPGVSDGSSVS